MIEIKDAPVIFDSRNHTYMLRKNSKFVPGVTSILNNLDKPFLKWWAAKEVVKDLGFYDPAQIDNKEEAIARAELIRRSIAAETTDEYLERLKAAKGAHAKKSKEALVSGKIAHTWIEDYIAGKNPPMPSDDKAVSAINAFLAWENEHQVEWLRSELIVGSEEHEYGGMLDGLAMVEGILTLVDFKTSSMIGDEYFLQTGAYSMALEEMGCKVDRRIILRIPKDGSEFESMVVPTSEEFDRETFLALRQITRWKSYVDSPDNLIKDRGGRIIIKK